MKRPDKGPSAPSSEPWDAARREAYANSLHDMSGLASASGRGMASLLLRAAGDALLARPLAQGEPGLCRLIYVSRPTAPNAAQARLSASEILAVARAHNAAHNITGALLSSPAWFAQVLEGEARAVEALYARITRDPRHASPCLLSLRPIRRRTFASWSMAHAGEAPATLIRRALAQWKRQGSCEPVLREMMALLRVRLAVV